MALDLVGGPLFTLLYDGVKEAMVKTTQFKSLLADLKSTLDSLQPRIIEQIGEHNTELGLPNEEIEDLQRKMEEGVKLVGKFSEFRVWNYCCVGDYTDQLIELERALRRLLEMLRIQEARDVKENLLLSRQNRDKLDEVNRRLIEIQKLLEQQQTGGAMEATDSGNSTEAVPGPIQGNGIQAVAAFDGGDALEVVFGMLFDAVLEVEDKAVMFKIPLGDLKSTLVSLKPLIEEISQHNKVLVLPKDELEQFTKEMEIGVELIPKCSKVHPWSSCKRSTYSEKLIGLESSLQRQLYIFKRQVARDVRNTLVSIRNIEEVIEQIENSGVLQNQVPSESCSAVAETSRPTVGLDVVNVQGTRDELEIMNSTKKTDAGVKPIEGSGVVQNQLLTNWSEVDEPSLPTVGLDVVDMQGNKGVEEIMSSIKNTEAEIEAIEEDDVEQNQLKSKGTKLASEDDTLLSRVSKMFRRKIVLDTSSSAGTSMLLEEKASKFRIKDDNQSIGGHMKTSNLRAFSYKELKTATRNFSTVLGNGSFRRFLKGWLDETTLAPSKPGTGMIVAIMERDTKVSNRRVNEWQAELNLIARISHPNIVKLLGYCSEKHHRFLVFEYMQNGSLSNHLFKSIPLEEPLSWENRLKVATGAARGLSFLHSIKIIHRDIKPFNILLDEDYNAKLSDFSLAMKLGSDYEESESVSTTVAGTWGYLDPEYVVTGRVSLKSDVYGFGVVLLEILTGLKSIDPRRSEEQYNLVEWAGPLLCDETKLETIMDERIKGQYSSEEALQTVQLALRCLETDPESRPSMEEVVEELECI